MESNPPESIIRKLVYLVNVEVIEGVFLLRGHFQKHIMYPLPVHCWVGVALIQADLVGLLGCFSGLLNLRQISPQRNDLPLLFCDLLLAGGNCSTLLFNLGEAPLQSSLAGLQNLLNLAQSVVMHINSLVGSLQLLSLCPLGGLKGLDPGAELLVDSVHPRGEGRDLLGEFTQLAGELS